MLNAARKPLDVSEFPSLSWVAKLPSWAEPKLGTDQDGKPMLVLWNEKHQLHVDWYPGDEFDWTVAANCLGGAIFHKEHPSAYSTMFTVKAKCLAEGRPVPDEIEILFKRLTELSILGENT